MDYRLTYIFLAFIPGSGGNFISRCINLLDNAYCHIDSSTKALSNDLSTKLDILSYNSVGTRNSVSQDWVKFERLACHYSKHHNHYDLPDGSYSIWYDHPIANNTQWSELQSPGHRNLFFYIDPTEAFEWALMNALYKNSYHNVNWFIGGKGCLDSNKFIKLNLKNIIDSKETFFVEFEKICRTIGHTMSEEEQQAISLLYDQWKPTTLDYKDIPKFKEEIGFSY